MPKIRHNTARIRQRLRKIGEQLPDGMGRILREAADESIPKIKAITPVDTGWLRSNWKVRKYRRGAEIYNNVYYGVYQLGGTLSDKALDIVTSSVREKLRNYHGLREIR